MPTVNPQALRLPNKVRRLRPFGKRVVILPAPSKDKTESGLIIPEDAQRPSLYGEILFVGPEVPDTYEPGMRVIFPQYAGIELNLDDGVHESVTVLVMDYNQLTAMVEVDPDKASWGSEGA